MSVNELKSGIFNLCCSIILLTGFVVFFVSDASAERFLAVIQIKHSHDPIRVCVTSIYQDLGCELLALNPTPGHNPINPYPYGIYFGENMIPIGGQYMACAINLSTNQSDCAIGTNTGVKTPVFLTVPGSGNTNDQSNGLICAGERANIPYVSDIWRFLDSMNGKQSC